MSFPFKWESLYSEATSKDLFHWWPSSAVIILQLHKDNWCVPSVARVMWLAVQNKGDIRRLLGSLETKPKMLPQSTVQVENVVRVGCFTVSGRATLA